MISFIIIFLLCISSYTFSGISFSTQKKKEIPPTSTQSKEDLQHQQELMLRATSYGGRATCPLAVIHARKKRKTSIN